jgi:hypothetical protein
LILLTPHPGGFDYELDQNSNFSLKNDKVSVNTADTENSFCVKKNLDSTIARLAGLL